MKWYLFSVLLGTNLCIPFAPAFSASFPLNPYSKNPPPEEMWKLLLKSPEKPKWISAEPASPCHSSTVILQGKDPLENTENRIEVKHYAPSNPTTSQEGSVIIIPPTGKTNLLDKAYAWLLCRKGKTVWILNDWSLYDEKVFDFGTHDRATLRAVHASRGLIQIIREKFPQHRLSILGTSLGALYASFLLPLEDPDSAAILLSGSPMWQIIDTSDQEGLVHKREVRMKDYGITREKYSEILSKNVVLSPEKISEKRNLLPNKPSQTPSSHPILLILSEGDTTVATVNQWDFANHLKKSEKNLEIVRLKNGHFFSILESFIFYRNQIFGTLLSRP